MANIFIDEMINTVQREYESLTVNDSTPNMAKISRFIKTCLDYNDMLKNKNDKIKVIIILYKLLSSHIGLKFLIDNRRFLITSQNKLQEMICTSPEFPDFQTELLSYQKEIDPDFHYINMYTKNRFDHYLYLYHSGDSKIEDL